jgi:hypothetical protein
MTERVIIDIWGGEKSQDHVARFIRSLDDVLEMVKDALHGGYLVNIRSDAAWGDYEEFDERVPKVRQ